MNDDIQWMKYDMQTKNNTLTGHLFVASLQALKGFYNYLWLNPVFKSNELICW